MHGSSSFTALTWSLNIRFVANSVLLSPPGCLGSIDDIRNEGEVALLACSELRFIQKHGQAASWIFEYRLLFVVT